MATLAELQALLATATADAATAQQTYAVALAAGQAAANDAAWMATVLDPFTMSLLNPQATFNATTGSAMASASPSPPSVITYISGLGVTTSFSSMTSLSMYVSSQAASTTATAQAAANVSNAAIAARDALQAQVDAMIAADAAAAAQAAAVAAAAGTPANIAAVNPLATPNVNQASQVGPVTTAPPTMAGVTALNAAISSILGARVTGATAIGGSATAAPPTWATATDLRVRLRVPQTYISGAMTMGPSGKMQANGGILFPYTPTISLTNTANYDTKAPAHSNYSFSFYKGSSIGQITLEAPFTVQNENDGAMLLSIIHLLRALTKMRYGDDADAGAPPPVCRLDAYGDSMMNNVPVAIASWSHNLPKDVDYMHVGTVHTQFGHTMVPTMSTISLTMNVMYSRQEMMAYNVTGWLNGSFQNRGYL